MSNSGSHDRTPDWQVLAVFDEHGEGRDFAYTVGLGQRGLPEIQMWAYPSTGDDPGHDWRFSNRDMMSILNDVAWRLIDGRISAGDTWEEPFDAGLVAVRFQLDPAVDAEEVEAFQAAPTDVHPLRWSLHRPPEGDLVPMSANAREEAERQFDDVLDSLPGGLQAVPGWDLPRVADWAPDQRWGPRTPNVLAAAAVIRAFSADSMIALVNLTFALEARHLVSDPQVVAAAAAREVGRTPRLRQLQDDLDEIVGGMGTRWGHDAWAAANDWLNDGEPEPFPEDRLRAMVGSVISSHLLSVAVEDRLSLPDVLAGLGPLAAVGCMRGAPPDHRWHASEHVIERVIRLVEAAGPERTVMAAQAWADSVEDEATDAQATIVVISIRNAAMFPYLFSGEPPGVLAGLLSVANERGVKEWVVQDWLTTIATVLTYRVEIGESIVELLLGCGTPHMPGLVAVVNSPIVGE